ncbi:MAG: hypothetical protein HY735_28140 [Verrucomicrobia bacterium]|nr:hypothetical protein [Verrucomicrobiota bacterium]
MLALLLFFDPSPVSARVVRLEITSRQEILNGRAFGLAGGFEKVAGKAHFAVEPANAANRIITDIDLAPRNAQGEVEFASDFFLIKPKDMARANGTVLYEVSNRGGKGMLGFFNLAAGSPNPETEAHFGDGFLLREGYTLLWVGWQFDPPRRDELMRLYPPIAASSNGPIRGLVRSDFVATKPEFFHSLADRNHVPYPVADPDASGTQLTVRDAVEAPRQVIPRSQWQFARVENGAVVPDSGHVHLNGGFEPGRIYEVVYVSENPPLVGLGPAAIRDLISSLKYQDNAALSIPTGMIRRAVGFGISQSGRFLRTFLYYGFNRDEKDRKVFDGMLSHVAGGGRGSFNHRFAQPSRDAHPFMNFLYPTDIFPFTDVAQTDPESGLTDGLLNRLAPQFTPKIFYSNSSYEYWGRAASLIHTSIDGKQDAPIPPNTRIYLFAGSQHGPAGFPPTRGIGQQLSNPMDFRWAMRALLTAMNRWIGEGSEPPPSRYPRISDGTLVAPEHLHFPALPNVNFSTRLHKAYRVDYGPEFRTKGIVSIEPPKVGSAFPMMVPAVDADGNETAGIKMPELAAPLATYTGWNLFNVNSGPTHEISSMAGSYLPFARTRAERDAAKDFRRSIEERYASREAYLGLIAAASLELIDQGYLLRQDMAEVAKRAARHWEYRTRGSSD